MPEILTSPEGRRLAHELIPGAGPAVVFLGGFRSDMTGTKAVWLRDWARARGRAFLRFDYSGHGASGGVFEEGCIGDWLEDARAALSLVAGPVVLVGSSMGGWLSLLIARDDPARVAGLVTIAAAPDFTEWHYRSALGDAARIAVPSDYGEPYVITRHLVQEGARHLVLDRPLSLPMPVRMLQGSADADVPVALAQRLFAHAQGPDIRLTLVKGADHRFSTPDCLEMIGRAVGDLS